LDVLVVATTVVYFLIDPKSYTVTDSVLFTEAVCCMIVWISLYFLVAVEMELEWIVCMDV
jgi:hypothetical protein